MAVFKRFTLRVPRSNGHVYNPSPALEAQGTLQGGVEKTVRDREEWEV